MGRRRRKGRPVHGWLILDKPEGLTSTEAVGRVKRLFDAQKAGHGGTLDPLATGVLPIAMGEATKTVSHVMAGQKQYRFTVAWGAETSTDDKEGEVLRTSDHRPSREEVAAQLPNFRGEILQVPPQFSAVRVEGMRAYDLAREGVALDLAPRPVMIDELEIVAVPDPDTMVFEASCGKGTYVRALARDLGRALGCYGHVTALRRSRVGPFDEAQAISLDKLEALSHSDAGRDALMACLEPVETALDDIPALAVSSSDAARLKRGQAVLLRGRDAPVVTGPVYAISKGVLVALGEVERGELRPTRVFHLT